MTAIRPAGRARRIVATALPLVLGAGVFVVSGTHVVRVAMWAGQPEWAALLIAGTGELMAIAALLAILDRSGRMAMVWPVVVLTAAIGFAGAANLASAGPDSLRGDPGAWTQIMAVWPVVAFALVVGLKVGHQAAPVPPVAVPAPDVAAESRPPVADVPTQPELTPTLDVPERVEPERPLTRLEGPAYFDAVRWIIATEPDQTSAVARIVAESTLTEYHAAMLYRATVAADRTDDTVAPTPVRGATRARVAELVSQIPADDGRSARQLAEDLAPQVGVTVSTVRNHLTHLRRQTVDAL